MEIVTNISIEKPSLNELMHVGVKGMHWGHHKRVEESSLDDSPHKKLTPEQKKKIKKILLATAAVTMVAVTAYYMHNQHQIKTSNIYGVKVFGDLDLNSKRFKDAEDITINKGGELRRISRTAETSFKGDRLYTSFDKNDSRRYKKLFESHLGTKKLYNIKLSAINDIKAPSERKSFDIMESMFKNNTNGFADEVINKYYHNPHEGYEELKNTTRITKNWYESIMTKMINADDPVTKIYTEHLKNIGYNALIDANDVGSYAKRPLIVLDPKMNIAIKSANRVTTGERIINNFLVKKIKT